MLKFLDDQHNQKQNRTMIKFLPNMVYGHTQDSSPHMLNKHSIFYHSTDKLPTVKQRVQDKLPPCVK